MNKKNSIATTLALILCSCTHLAPNQQEQILSVEADKIPPQAQVAYFECEFVRHTAECQELVWKTHPNPKPETGLNREFVMQRFLPEMDKRGAGVILEQHGIRCDDMQLHSMFWKHGYSATCQDGAEYIIDHVKGEWSIIKQPAQL